MDFRALFLGLAFALMWSSAFTSARIIVAEAPPILSLALRFAISGGVGVALALAMGQTARLTRGQWTAVVVFGICQNALYLGLNFVAMQWIEASLAAIVASVMPLLVAVCIWVLLGERTRPLGVAGLIAGTLGVALIMGTRGAGRRGYAGHRVLPDRCHGVDGRNACDAGRVGRRQFDDGRGLADAGGLCRADTARFCA